MKCSECFKEASLEQRFREVWTPENGTEYVEQMLCQGCKHLGLHPYAYEALTDESEVNPSEGDVFS